MANKTNEIIAVPALLKPLNVEGSLITIEAIACQKEIVELIVKTKADYLIGL